MQRYVDAGEDSCIRMHTILTGTNHAGMTTHFESSCPPDSFLTLLDRPPFFSHFLEFRTAHTRGLVSVRHQEQAAPHGSLE